MTENPYAATSNPFSTGSQPPSAPMTISEILFSYEGRIPRSTYWGASLGVGLLAGLVIVGVTIAGLVVLGEESPIPLVLALVCYIPFLYSMFAIQAKRWHDRDKSGWWALIGLIPYIGGFWVLIECGCLEGTPGQNRFGNNPLH